MKRAPGSAVEAEQPGEGGIRTVFEEEDVPLCADVEEPLGSGTGLGGGEETREMKPGGVR